MKYRALACCLWLVTCTPIEPPASGAHGAMGSKSEQLPCAVDRILRGKCQACHGQPPQNDAPMPLTTWHELHAPVAQPAPARTLVYERVAQRIHDMERPMPPEGLPPLTEAELSALDIWLAAGAPQGEACKTAPDAGVAGSGNTPASPRGTPASPGDDSPDAAVSTAGAGAARGDSKTRTGTAGHSGMHDSAGAMAPPDAGPVQPTGDDSDGPSVPSDSDCEYIDVVARSDASGAPYRIDADAGDDYICFIYDLNFEGPRQALAIEPLVDNRAVVHHWVLYTLDALGSRGITARCDEGYQSDYKVIGGGAPGSDAWYLPKSVGLELGRGLFMLEVHYNNLGKPATTDKSGARICSTRTLRRNTATVSWVGSELFSIPAKATDYTVSNRCRPQRQEPIHLLRFWPHMNRLGKRSSLRVDRPDGSDETLHNAPYSLELQRSYPLTYVLQPGESLVSTCYYDNPGNSAVSIGFRASDEMCNHFVIAYPAYALTNGNVSAWADACVGR